MKPLLHRFVALLMATFVLVTSTGFGLVEHSCVVKGKSVHLLSSQKSCGTCSAPHKNQHTSKTTVRKASCCKDEHKYENLDVSSSVTQVVAKAAKAAVDVVVGLVVSFVEQIAESFEDSSSSASINAAPPSFFGRDLLAFVQSFLL